MSNAASGRGGIAGPSASRDSGQNVCLLPGCHGGGTPVDDGAWGLNRAGCHVDAHADFGALAARGLSPDGRVAAPLIYSVRVVVCVCERKRVLLPLLCFTQPIFLPPPWPLSSHVVPLYPSHQPQPLHPPGAAVDCWQGRCCSPVWGGVLCWAWGLQGCCWPWRGIIRQRGVAGNWWCCSLYSTSPSRIWEYWWESGEVLAKNVHVCRCVYIELCWEDGTTDARRKHTHGHIYKKGGNDWSRRFHQVCKILIVGHSLLAWGFCKIPSTPSPQNLFGKTLSSLKGSEQSTCWISWNSHRQFRISPKPKNCVPQNSRWFSITVRRCQFESLWDTLEVNCHITTTYVIWSLLWQDTRTRATGHYLTFQMHV